MSAPWYDTSRVGRNVWKLQTAFDADKWEGDLQARIKLCAVPWDSEYKNVIDWESEEARDDYFAELHGYVWDTNTNWNFKSLEVWKAGLGKHQGSIKVDLPYEAALNFNYLAVELYEQPVPGQPGNRREIYFYFMNSLNKKAANTTELFLELDTWTTYRNSVNLSAIELKRGHYFHAKTDAQSFLADPLNNSLGLTAVEDELPSLQPLVSHSQLVSFSKSAPRICIATTGDFTNNRSWFTVIPDSPEDEPDGRPVAFPSGSQPGKMSAPWNPAFEDERGDYNAADTAYLKPSVKQQENGSGSTESLNVYSMTPDDFILFINHARQNVQQILPTIKAVYVLDSAVISESDSFTQWGFEFKVVSQSADPKLIESLNLQLSHFNYSEKARDYAKLYTGQFAKLEISNLQGGRAEIAIEEISETLDFYSRSSSLFPFLKLEALIDGVGGRGVKSYAVKPLSSISAKSFTSRWEDYVMDLDVPVYSIYIAKDQELGQIEKLNREQKARGIKEERDFTKERALRDWMAGSNTALKTNVIASNSLENDYLLRLAVINKDWNNRDLEIGAAYDIAIAAALKEYNNAGMSLFTAYDNAFAANAVEFANAKRTNTADFQNTSDTVTATKDISLNSIESAKLVSTADLSVPFDTWFNIERGANLKLANEQFWEAETRFDTTWKKKKDIFDVSIDVAVSSTAMGVMTSANMAAFGAIGSGISSIPAGTIGAALQGYGRATPAQMGIGAFTPGAVAGVAIADAIKTAISTIAINEQIWNLQAAQSAMLHAPVADVRVPKFSDPSTYIEYYGPGIKQTEFYGGFDIDLAGFGYEQNMLMHTSFETGRDTVVGDGASRLQMAVGTQNIAQVYSTDKTNAERTFDTGVDVMYRTYNAQLANITDTFNMLGASIDRTKAKDISIQEANSNQSKYAAELTKNTSEEVNTANRTTNTKVADENVRVGRINIRTEYYNALAVNDKNKEVSELGADVHYGLNRGEWSADFLTAIQGDPGQYAVDGGKAWVDIWGTRGLEVRVRRCTDATAEQAASIFGRYGYRNEGMFIEPNSLTLMTKATYWEGESPWIVGDRINETNKEIFRRIFRRGVFIWSDPGLILTSIADNRPL